jgi:hypothetical protein
MRNVSRPQESSDSAEFGLCAECCHARRIVSDRGATFLQCQLSFTDPSFAKYPRLPVVSCSGYSRPGSVE